jgi:hypothetical protein
VPCVRARFDELLLESPEGHLNVTPRPS